MMNDEIKDILEQFKKKKLCITFNGAEEASECWHWLKDNGIKMAPRYENSVYPTEEDIKNELRLGDRNVFYYTYYDYLVWGFSNTCIPYHFERAIPFESIRQMTEPRLPIDKEEFMQFLLEA